MVRTSLGRRLGGPLMAAGLAASLVNTSYIGAHADPAEATRITLPVGTVIPVQLNSELSSKKSQPGDKFTATVKYGRDDAGMPEGTRIEGVVKEALPSGDGKPGVLDVDFRRIDFPGGESRAIEASLYSLDGKSVKRSDGRLVATSDKSKDRLKWVGIGAGAGVLISALTKGNALVEGLLGAGAGYLFNELQNKKPGDVALKQGSEFGVRLDRQLAFNSDDRSYFRKTQESAKFDRYGERTKTDDRYYTEQGRDTYGDNSIGDQNPNRYDREDRFNRDRRATSDNNDIGMMINDREVRFDSSARPFMRGDVIFLPLTAVGRAGSFDYRYDASGRTIYARNNKIRVPVDSRVAFVNGQRRRLPAAPEVRGGTVYVPMQFIGWAANGSVAWDSGSRTVVLTTDRDRY
jgi:hypothetical protein